MIYTMEAVRFNVGGKLFFTTKATIGREPSSRLASQIQLQQPDQQTGAWFVDRWEVLSNAFQGHQ